MLGGVEKRLLGAFVAGRVTGRDIVVLAEEITAITAALPSLDGHLEGMDVSVALRAAGFNRAYEIDGRKANEIIYRRRAA